MPSQQEKSPYLLSKSTSSLTNFRYSLSPSGAAVGVLRADGAVHRDNTFVPLFGVGSISFSCLRRKGKINSGSPPGNKISRCATAVKDSNPVFRDNKLPPCHACVYSTSLIDVFRVRIVTEMSHELAFVFCFPYD